MAGRDWCGLERLNTCREVTSFVILVSGCVPQVFRVFATVREGSQQLFVVLVLLRTNKGRICWNLTVSKWPLM